MKCAAVCVFLGSLVRLSSWGEEPWQTLCPWAALGLCCVFLLSCVAPWQWGWVAATALRGTECGAASTPCPHQQPSLTWFMQTSTFPCWQNLVRGPAYITTISLMFYVVGVASYNIDSCEHDGGKCS